MTADDLPPRAPQRELDLREILPAVWARRRLVLTIVTAAILLSLLNAITSPVRYSADAVFRLKATRGMPNLPAELSSLAGLAGFNMKDDSTAGIFDRLAGRNFILPLTERAGLASDPYFNETLQPPSFLGRLLGGGTPPADPVEAARKVEESIQRVYARSTSLVETKDGSLRISVQHEDAARAAELANGIVSLAVDQLSEEHRIEQEQQLTYLSDRLADSLTDVERTKKQVADFALANSLASPQAFATRSAAINELSDSLYRARQMQNGVEEVRAALTTNAAPGRADYDDLRGRAPIIDDIDFRRLLGLPEALAEWRWPPRDRLASVTEVLRDRTARIERSISELRDEATRYAASTERLATLEREAKVAEATYSVLIEQVKAQTLVAGYEGKVADIYQSAVAPLKKSGPKRLMIMVVGTLLGLFLGTGLALAQALRSGRLHARPVLDEWVGADLVAVSPGLGRLGRTHAERLPAALEGVTAAGLSGLLVALRQSQPHVVLVAASAPQIATLPTALWLSRWLLSQGRSPAILLAGEAPRGKMTGEPLPDLPLARYTLLGEGEIFWPAEGTTAEDLLTSTLPQALLRAKDEGGFNVIIVAASAALAPVAARLFTTAGQGFTVLLTKPGLTSRNGVDGIRQITPIDAQLRLMK